MSRLGAQREGLRLRLQTVTTGNPVVIPYDALGQELPPNCIIIGLPSAVFDRAEPLGPGLEIGRRAWFVTWPIDIYLARTTDRASTDLCDAIWDDILDAIASDPTLSGTVTASSLEAVTVENDDPDQPARHHLLHITVQTATFINE